MRVLIDTDFLQGICQMKTTMLKMLLAVSFFVAGTLIVIGVTAAGDDKGAVVTLDGLKSRVPASWKMQKPSNKFRAYQFEVPRAEGDKKDAELVIFYFGAGSGGNVADNLKRWKSQFQPPEGKTIDDVSKVEKKKVADVDLHYLDIQGTYLFKFPPFDPNAKTTKLPEYRRLGVYFASENGPYFITLTGPEKTVAQHKKGFDDWLKNFK
jgi:hypothetical protein